ncbi:MAG: hypothetical protein E3J50_01800, partial [Dehalococcoidia bacterium]
MKQEDLIKRLENLETPEIELPGHRQALRMALLNSGRFRKRTVLDWAKMLAPVSAALVLIAVVGFFNVIQPQLQIAQAKEIARNDPQVQALLQEYGLEIAEVKLENGEAFVLVAPQCLSASALDSAAGSRWHLFRRFYPPPEVGLNASEDEAPAPSGEGLSPGYLLKVDLLEKKVIGFREIEEVTALRDI